jgi:hypothetical protein
MMKGMEMTTPPHKFACRARVAVSGLGLVLIGLLIGV